MLGWTHCLYLTCIHCMKPLTCIGLCSKCLLWCCQLTTSKLICRWGWCVRIKTLEPINELTITRVYVILIIVWTLQIIFRKYVLFWTLSGFDKALRLSSCRHWRLSVTPLNFWPLVRNQNRKGREEIRVLH